MGARVFFNLRQSDNNFISLYSHWGEDSRHTDLAIALDHARPRWSDESYCARIIVSQLIGDDWNSETGYGLMAGNQGMYDETAIDVDLELQTVTDEIGTHSYDEFITYTTGAKLTKV